MIRQALLKRKHPDLRFRHRGTEVSRLEGISDAVFGFALTLLVVSLEVPKTFDALMTSLKGFLAFGVCFAVLFQIWTRHFLFFRRYGLEDHVTRMLNAALLFVVLGYVYPLKFLMSTFVDVWSVGGPNLISKSIREEQLPQLFAVYGAGFGLIYFLFGLLYFNANRLADQLELTPFERLDTRWQAVQYMSISVVTLLSVLLAAIGGKTMLRWAVGSYALIIVAVVVLSVLESQSRSRFERHQEM